MASSDILRVEIFAIFQGLLFAWNRGFQNVICETDSLEAFRAITAYSVHPRHASGVLIREIHCLLTREWSVSFSHVLQSGNLCADFLARQGAVSNSGFMVWESPSTELAWLLRGDMF